ncbi:hypothetical protein [Cellulophaga sp. Hel_I_12]|uniref:hypothetical protein n=1 Tax=Cellulophaga sp. Hel_I_12 TaxID=1249972 RepID=UPI000646DAF7|nr:hypothetical protein [Cellulophaga sp. Hel_I_12]
MSNYIRIQDKLQGFIKKYYTLQLVKGVILFLSLGALIFFFVVSLEYFLWLGSVGRLMLLLVLGAFESVLLYRYILVPVLYLLKLKKGLTDSTASNIIGKHFPEINDKLYNLVDLAGQPKQSELVVASIEQRSKGMGSFNFSKAISFKGAFKHLKYLGGPLIIIALLWLSGNISSFFGSYDRVLSYNVGFEPPAPFSFVLITEKMTVLEKEDLTLKVMTEGKVRPEEVYVDIDGTEYRMQQSNGYFTYVIRSPLKSKKIRFLSGELKSREYTLKVLETPGILDFSLHLEYPKYIDKQTEIIKGVGNALIPEGTKVNWRIETQNTNTIQLKVRDTAYDFNTEESQFFLTKVIRNSMEYAISTSNQNVIDFESLEYSLKVIKDEYPSIQVQEVLDSLQPNVRYYKGQITDDYGVSAISLVYFETDRPDKIIKVPLNTIGGVTDSFYYTYPSGMDLQENIPYSFYFEVVDNDGVNGSKATKSNTFRASLYDENYLMDKQLENQQSLISNFDKSVEKFKTQSRSLEELNKDQKEKSELNFNDKQKVNRFLENQQVQEAQMQKFSKQLRENLENLEKEDELNELLQERLERQERQAEKNKKLLEELQKVADKINKEELSKRLDDLAKKQKGAQRNLEQLLELTKQYYVTEKASQLAKDLEKLAEKQELLSKMKMLDFKEEDAYENQSKLNQEFNELDKGLQELEKDNDDLKKPLVLNIDEQLSRDVKADQKLALEEINKQQGVEQSSESGINQTETNKAAKKQKSAADKMKEMAARLQQSSSGAGGSSVAEDAEVLRQILDNLIVFTFKQENLLEQLTNDEGAFKNQAKAILEQQELKALFSHIDDSLFALSLRVPEISENINTEVSEVFYNTDKAMEAISENNMFQGISYQKYVLTSGNTLSDLLASILENMNQSMQSGKGEGQGEDFQLPDIIKAQSKLNKEMEKKGEGSSSSQAKNGKDGEEGTEGEGTAKGESGSNGQDGKEGQQGKGQNSTKDGPSGTGEGGKGESQGKGNKNGASGNGGTGGQGISEEEMKEIYEIYKQQELIKQNLEEQLNSLIENSDRQLAQKLLQQMTDFQNNLLENGITQSTIENSKTIQYQLLKLEGAALKQGKKDERESDRARVNFANPITTKPKSFMDFQQEEEILNRQALPLRQNFKKRIKEYFKNND